MAKFKMFMRSRNTGKFIKRNDEQIATKEMAKIWTLTDDANEASDDPGFVAGQDFNMEMIMFLSKKYNECSFEMVGEEDLK